MDNRNCDECDRYVVEWGYSPWCKRCDKTMCPECKKEHDARGECTG